MVGVIDNGVYWHIITSTLFQGGAIIMGLAMIVGFLSPQEWVIRGVNMRVTNSTMVALLVVWNLAMGILAMVTGIWMTWGFGTVTHNSLTINKEMFGTFALLALLVMLWLRFRYGAELWDDVALKLSYLVLGLIVVAVAIVNGSLGGEAGLLGSILVPFWEFLGITPRYPMILPTVGGMVFLVLAVGATALAVAAGIMRRRRLS